MNFLGVGVTFNDVGLPFQSVGVPFRVWVWPIRYGNALSECRNTLSGFVSDFSGIELPTQCGGVLFQGMGVPFQEMEIPCQDV